MKKTLLSASAFALVAVSSMALAPTKAEAIPAFARQTGAACLSCHFQQFPALNAYGRMFKEGSFTDVGDEALVEGENLSIPAVLNATFVVRAQAVHTSNGTLPANTTAATSSTAYTIPADQNLLIAGRAGSNTGVFVEFGPGPAAVSGTTATAGGGANGQGGINNIQVMNSFDLGGFKAGISYANTSFGADAILAVNSVYGQHSGVMNNFGDVSAVNNSGLTNQWSNIGAWVGNDMGFIQVGLIAPGSVVGGGNNIGLKMAKLVKVAGTFDLGGFDTIIGAGTVAGKIGKTSGTVTQAANADMQWVYGQMQGDLGDMSLGVYADWAHAKGKAGGNVMGANDMGTALAATNTLAGMNSITSGDKFDAYSLRATLAPTRRTLVGIGYGYRKTSIAAAGATVANSNKHQLIELGASYMIYQNNILSLTYQNDKVTWGTAPTGNVNGNIKTTTLDYLIML
ncbi:MAG TPA: hypothetical protein VJ961_08070 [Mariprofundaceae bacterium]|nr:hypothetical protein [Mariprofundaceae bacterium]